MLAVFAVILVSRLNYEITTRKSDLADASHFVLQNTPGSDKMCYSPLICVLLCFPNHVIYSQLHFLLKYVLGPPFPQSKWHSD